MRVRARVYVRACEFACARVCVSVRERQGERGEKMGREGKRGEERERKRASEIDR